MVIDKPKLASYLAEKLKVNDLSITSVWKNLEGWSMETYSLGLSYYDQNNKHKEHEIILRKEPDAGLMEDNYDLSIEYRVLKGLYGTDVAVPKTFWLEEDPGIMGKPFYTMEKVEGKIPFPPAQSFDPNYRMIPDDDLRSRIAKDFIRNLAAIHTVDWKSIGLDFLGVPAPGTGSALMEVEFWEDRIARSGFGYKPAIVYAVNWLKANLVENDRICLVHGDFRSGNYIAGNNRIRAVLDWELVHLGDHLHDIAYALSAWRGAPPERWISHLLPEEEFFELYEAETGFKIDKEKLEFYMMLHTLKAVGITSTAAGTFKRKNKLNLKVGVFGMTQHIACLSMITELRNQSSKMIKGAS